MFILSFIYASFYQEMWFSFALVDGISSQIPFIGSPLYIQLSVTLQRLIDTGSCFEHRLVCRCPQVLRTFLVGFLMTLDHLVPFHVLESTYKQANTAHRGFLRTNYLRFIKGLVTVQKNGCAQQYHFLELKQTRPHLARETSLTDSVYNVFGTSVLSKIMKEASSESWQPEGKPDWKQLFSILSG